MREIEGMYQILVSKRQIKYQKLYVAIIPFISFYKHYANLCDSIGILLNLNFIHI